MIVSRIHNMCRVRQKWTFWVSNVNARKTHYTFFVKKNRDKRSDPKQPRLW